MSTNLQEIVFKFKVEGKEITTLEKYGEGHIHSTHLVILDNKHEYILQKINHSIFKNVDGLMSNIVYVTNYLKEEIIKEGGDVNKETLNVVPTTDDKNYYYDSENDAYYRIYVFVKDTIAHQSIKCEEDFAAAGEAFAKFALKLNNFDVSKLVETIPNFHNTKTRFAHFVETLKADKYNRAKDVQEEIKFVLDREEDCNIVVDLMAQGLIPAKVTHNDPKLNNILFDSNTNKPICIIDLDTIMPGTILYDFGDAIRFGANPAGENEKDVSKVVFHMGYYKAFAKGYIKGLEGKITESEKKYLAFAAKLMTLECGIRFLDDYLDGNNYFHVQYEEHNLVRARTQFKLVKDMEENFEEMNKIIFEE